MAKKRTKKDPHTGKKYARVSRDGETRAVIRTSCPRPLKRWLTKFCGKNGKGHPYTESHHIIQALNEYKQKYDPQTHEQEGFKEEKKEE